MSHLWRQRPSLPFVMSLCQFMSISHRVSAVPGLKFYHSQGESCRFARQGQTKSKRKTLFSKSNIILGISHIHWCNIHWISCHSQVTSKSWKLQLAAFGRFEVNVNLAGLGFSLLAPTSCALVATVKTGFSGSCPHSRTVMNLRSFWDRCFPWSSGRDGKRACLACVPPSPSALFLHVTISDFCFGPCQSSLISLSTGGMTASRSNDCWKTTPWEFFGAQGDENVTWSRSGRLLAMLVVFCGGKEFR